MWDELGPDVAKIAAYDMNLISRRGGGTVHGTFGRKSIEECRQWMHNELDGTNEPWRSRWCGT